MDSGKEEKGTPNLEKRVLQKKKRKAGKCITEITYTRLVMRFECHVSVSLSGERCMS